MGVFDNPITIFVLCVAVAMGVASLFL